MSENTRIVEINGIKMEVDLRNAKVVEQYKVGDSLKVLVKDGYGDKFTSYIGTIIGFDEFDKHPTIVIAYLKTSYNSGTIEYLYYNDTSKDAEVCPLNDWDIPVTKQQVIDEFDAEIFEANKKISEVEKKKAIFERLFGKYFEKIEANL